LLYAHIHRSILGAAGHIILTLAIQLLVIGAIEIVGATRGAVVARQSPMLAELVGCGFDSALLCTFFV
jgi:hypothetical protein